MPVVVSVTPAVPAVAVGPTVTVEVLATAYVGAYYNFTNYYLGLDMEGEIDVKTANGWGFNLSNYAYVNLAPMFYWGSSLRAELYRTMGNVDIGFFVAPYQISPLDIVFGPTFRYRTDRVEFWHETQFYVYPGTRGVEFANDVTFHPNDRLEVGGYFDFEIEFGVGLDIDFGLDVALDVNDRLKLEGWAWADVIGSPDAGFGGQATLDLGALETYLGVDFYFGGGFDAEAYAGFEYERQIGTGPLTFTAGAGVDYELGYGFGAYANIGIRLNIGDVDNLLFHDDD